MYFPPTDSKNTVALNNCKSKEGKLLIESVHYWLQELVNKERYHHKYSDTIKLILEYVDDNETRLGSCLFLMKEIIGSLQMSRSCWAHCYHTHIFDNYHTTQSLTESMNRSIKQMDSCYKGSKYLHNSTSTMLWQSEQLEKKENSKYKRTNCFLNLKYSFFDKKFHYTTFCFKKIYFNVLFQFIFKRLQLFGVT